MKFIESIDTSSRKIGIPKSIAHSAILVDKVEDSTLSIASALNNKLARFVETTYRPKTILTFLYRAKELWRKDSKHKRGLLFVPSSDNVSQMINILHFWGVSEAQDLQSLLGSV
jgi:hypothetical protein